MYLVPLLLAAGVHLIGASTPQTPDLSADPRFKKPISVELNNVPIQDALSAISKLAGATVDSSQSLSDLNVTAFAKNLPTNVLLDKIASVLNCTWTAEGDSYRLVMPQDVSTAEQKYLDAESLELRKDAEAQATAMADAASGSFDDFVRTVNGKQEQAVRSSSDLPELGTAPRTVPSVASYVENYQIGQVFRSWSSAQWDAFWGGEVAFASPPTAPGRRARRDPAVADRPPADIVFARYDAFGTHELQVATGQRPGLRPTFDIPPYLVPTDKLAETKFGKLVLAWPNVDAAQKSDAFTQQMTPESSPPTEATKQTLADQLQILFHRTDLPIVATGFRILPLNKPETPRGATPLAWLQSLAQMDHAFLRVEDGVAMVRQGGFWSLRAYEPPEVGVRALEQKGVTPSVADYATFLAQLTPAQTNAFLSSEPPKVSFDMDRIKNAIPALQFIGSLGTVPPMNTPVPYSAMGSNSQSLFMSAIFQCAFTGAKWEGKGPGIDPKNYGFVMAPADVQSTGGLASGLSFLFGSDLRDGVKYEAAVRL